MRPVSIPQWCAVTAGGIAECASEGLHHKAIGTRARFVAALRQQRLTAPMVVAGPMDGALFLVYMRQFLCPTLAPGDIVIWDNLSSHPVAGVREAIEAVGATLKPLPPYSPDFNPIEQVFAKLKAWLRKAGERTVEALWETLAKVLDQLTPAECENYLRGAGYTLQTK